MKKFRAAAFAVSCLAVLSAFLPVSAAGRYIRGDANGDGAVDINDATAIQRHLAQLEQLSTDQLKAADVNGDGLDITDAAMIQMYLLQYDNSYKIGETVNDYELPFCPI